MSENHNKKICEITERVDDASETCSICLEDMSLSGARICRTTCGHYFHSPCLWSWNVTSASCPVCRHSPLSCQHGERNHDVDTLYAVIDACNSRMLQYEREQQELRDQLLAQQLQYHMDRIQRASIFELGLLREPMWRIEFSSELSPERE